jgi:hypothetical protein
MDGTLCWKKGLQMNCQLLQVNNKDTNAGLRGRDTLCLTQ